METNKSSNPLETFKYLVKLEHKLKQDLNISISEISVLVVLSAKKEQKMGDLVGKVELPMSTVTGIVDKLVAKELAIREKRADDKRVLILKITGTGREMLADCSSYIQELIASLACFNQWEEKAAEQAAAADIEQQRDNYNNNISRREIKIEWD